MGDENVFPSPLWPKPEDYTKEQRDYFSSDFYKIAEWIGSQDESTIKQIAKDVAEFDEFLKEKK